jgi:hypothetical protein
VDFYLECLGLLNSSLSCKDIISFNKYCPIVKEQLIKHPHYPTPDLTELFSHNFKFDEVAITLFHTFIDNFATLIPNEDKFNFLIDWLRYAESSGGQINKENTYKLMDKLVNNQTFEDMAMREKLLNAIGNSPFTGYLPILANHDEFKYDLNFYDISLEQIVINEHDTQGEKFLDKLTQLSTKNVTQVLSREAQMNSLLDLSIFYNINNSLFEKMVSLGARFTDEELKNYEVQHTKDNPKLNIYKRVLIEVEKNQLEQLLSEKKESKKLKL